MKSPFAASRRAAFNLPLAIVVGMAGLVISRVVRGHFPAPAGNGWLWACAVAGLVVAYGVSLKRGFSALRWIALFAGTYLTAQIIIQIMFSYGIMRI